MKTQRSLRFESLEDKSMLAIVWANEFDTGINDPQFGTYGANEAHARAIVNRAIDDWNSVILDQNFDNDADPQTNDFMLNVSAFDFATQGAPGGRGDTNITAVTNGGAGQVGWTVGVPTEATIRMDNNGGGLGWYFDTTPLDDIELTSIAGPFQASFLDVTTVGQQHVNDFYRTIAHEIGHSLGIGLVDGLDLNSGNWLVQNQVTQQTYSLPVDTSDDLLGNLSYVGYDQVNPTRTQNIFDPNTQLLQPFTVVNELWEYQLPGRQLSPLLKTEAVIFMRALWTPTSQALRLTPMN